MARGRAAPFVLDVVDVPKPGGGSRALTRLDPRAADVYTSLVTGLEIHAHGIVVEPGALPVARAAWTRALETSLGGGVAIRSDVRSCYPSITPRVAAIAVAEAGADRRTADRLEAFLRRCRREGTAGLPIGPTPSALVADAVLATADRAVRQAGGAIVRWVDDVVIAADGPRAAHRAFDAWRAALAELGLAPHDGKTALVESTPAILAHGCAWSRSARGMMRPP